jgi:heme-degrading monooxygenase HmoA
MHVIIWRYDVAPAHAAAFRAAYAPGGDWALLFARAPGFVKVELFESADGAFVTLDHWESEAAFDAFKAAYGDEYAALDVKLAHLSTAQQKLS